MLNKLSVISFTYTRKSDGPSTEPWGTPALIERILDLAVFTITDCLREDRLSDYP